MDSGWCVLVNVVKYGRPAFYSGKGRGRLLGGALERADEEKMLEINLRGEKKRREGAERKEETEKKKSWWKKQEEKLEKRWEDMKESGAEESGREKGYFKKHE